MQLLEVARQPEDLNIAGLRFHGNHRLTFGWSGENAVDVDFEDYH